MQTCGGVKVKEIDAAEFASSVAAEDMDLLVRTLARRPDGRQSILNCTTVTRALTQNKRRPRVISSCYILGLHSGSITVGTTSVNTSTLFTHHSVVILVVLVRVFTTMT